MSAQVKLQIVAAVFAFLAFVASVRRWSRLIDGDERQRTKAAVASVLFLIAAMTGGLAAYARAQEEDEPTAVDEYQDCIEEQEQLHGEPAGGLSQMAAELCERHEECDHLDGSRDGDGTELFTPEAACEILRPTG